MERAIHISSINREKTGENRPDNFLIKFNSPLKLDPEKSHSLNLVPRCSQPSVGNIW